MRRKGWEDEVPSLNWGAPKTGLEEVKIDNFLTKRLEVGYADLQMFLDILKQKGLSVNLEKEPQIARYSRTR